MIRKIKHTIISLAFLLLLFPENAFGQQYSDTELRAAFICNFAKFVEWPPNSFASNTSPIVIAFLNDSLLASVTEKLATNMNISGRKLKIIQCKNIEQAIHCNILYISPLEKDRFSIILSKLSGLPILTVSETEGFCQLKGIINFSKSKNKFGFEINVNSAKQKGIKISSKLLGLATIIQ